MKTEMWRTCALRDLERVVDRGRTHCSEACLFFPLVCVGHTVYGGLCVCVCVCRGPSTLSLLGECKQKSQTRGGASRVRAHSLRTISSETLGNGVHFQSDNNAYRVRVLYRDGTGAAADWLESVDP
ncbi:hypothetical protein F2P79_019180 [Pimephales promelas]|nr:hypothetical protein F2P79_019180 [Pimephales promelas]